MDKLTAGLTHGHHIYRTYAEPLHVRWALPTLLLAVAFKLAICVSPDLVGVNGRSPLQMAVQPEIVVSPEQLR